MLAIAGTVTKRPDKVASQATICPALSLSCAEIDRCPHVIFSSVVVQCSVRNLSSGFILYVIWPHVTRNVAQNTSPSLPDPHGPDSLPLHCMGTETSNIAAMATHIYLMGLCTCPCRNIGQPGQCGSSSKRGVSTSGQQKKHHSRGGLERTSQQGRGVLWWVAPLHAL